MFFEENTLLAVGAITSLLTAVIFAGLARTSLAVPGLRFWAASFLCVAISLGSNRFPLADWRLASIVFNLPLGFSDLFLLIGALRFVGKRPPRLVLSALGAWTIIVTLGFTLIWPDAGHRVALLAGHSVVVRGWSGLVFWRARRDTGQVWYRIVGAALLIESLAAAAQCLMAASAHASLSYALPEVPWANAIAWSGLTFGSILAGQMLLLLVALHLIGAMRDMANRDPLTGCLNRRGLRVTLEPCLAQATARHESFAVLMIDVDHFKQVNDHFGHAVGDRVLEVLGAVLRDNAEDAVAARWGGEEFITVLPGIEQTAAVAEAERLRARFARLAGELPELPSGCTLSVGIGYGPLTAEVGLAELCKAADDALYAAKRDGRDRVELRCLDGTR